MDNGWIKVYRQIEKKAYYLRSQYIHLWIHLLLRTNHEGKEWLWKGQIYKAKRGQFITSRITLSRETGINQSQIEKILNVFEMEHQIEQQKTNKNRLITILNYDKYQNKEQQNNTKITPKEHQNNTNKNIKNNKNTIAALPQAWNSKEYISSLLTDKNRHIRIIGKYFQYRGITFEKKEEAQVAIKRHLRPAKDLSVFDDNKIRYGFNMALNKYPEEWTLETAIKMLTK